MTQRSDVAKGREIIERWCALAEKRLDYLTELFESGRWRRYHTERAFLENLREAKLALETWRMLASREALPDNHAIDVAWLGGPAIPLARREQVLRSRGEPVPKPIEVSIGCDPVDAPPPECIRPDEVPSSRPQMVQPGWEKTVDLAAIQERYPLLRNAL